MEAFNFTVKNLQDIILFLLPGFTLIILFFYQIPDRNKSDLTIIFFSVISSVIINGLNLWIFQFIHNITHLKINIQTNASENFLLINFLLSIVFSILLAKFARSKYFRMFSKKVFNVDTSPFGRVWNDFFNVQQITVLRIYLQDGTCYIGKLDKASIDPDDDIQELTIVDPYYFELKKGKPTVTAIKEVSSVLLQGNVIKSIEKIKYDEAKRLYQLP